MLEFVSYDPSMSLMKYIFVDLDECVLHSNFLGAHFNPGAKKDRVIAKATKVYGPVFELDRELYTTKMRPGALDLLRRLREIYGNEYVRVLTSSVTSYANKNNEIHGFGFRPDQIFAREDMNKMNFGIKEKVIPFIPGRVALIDNLPPRDNHEKLEYLHPLLDRGFVSYVTVTEFWGYEDDYPFDDKYISEIVERIEDGFAS